MNRGSAKGTSETTPWREGMPAPARTAFWRRAALSPRGRMLRRSACRALVLLVCFALPSALGRAAASRSGCAGDCNGDFTIDVAEIVTGTTIALGGRAIEECPSFDANDDGTVAIEELLGAVNNALNGCPLPTPALTPTPAGPWCGDGILQRLNGERCDDGNTVDGDGCDSNCHLTWCGNHTVDAGEKCDDGNTTSEDGCSAQCRVEGCGDAVRQAALGEQCDDGNGIDGDG